MPPIPAVVPGASLPPVMDVAQLLKRQAAVIAMGRRAIAPPETGVLLQDAGLLVADIFEADCAVVAQLSPDGDRLRARVVLRRPGLADLQCPLHELSALGDQSLAGYVLQVAHPVVLQDLSEEVRFRDPLLRKFGVRSALAMPLAIRERALGVLMVCSEVPRRFDVQDIAFVETIGHLAATSIARSQVEQRCAEEHSFAQGLLQTVEALVMVLDAEGQILHMNRACQQVSGFDLAELKSRPVWSVMATPAEASLYSGMLAQLRGGEARVAFESFLLGKHGQTRRIRWSCSLLPAAQGDVKTILATGTDITQQYLAQEAANLAEQALAARQATDGPPAICVLEGEELSDADLPEASPSPASDAPAVGWDGYPRERRRQPRRAYPCRQKISPILNGKLPTRSQFREVQCYDISTGGIAYLAEEPPASDQLVVVLGSPPRLIFLTAEVVYVSPTVQNGKPMYRIGCKYTGRAPSC